MNTTERKPVDVLADLDELIVVNHIAVRGDSQRSLMAIHAAVAELIEADKYYDDARFGLARARYNGDPLAIWVEDCAKAEIRRTAALARVQGGGK